VTKPRPGAKARRDWGPMIEAAKRIVNSTFALEGVLLTVRGIHYALLKPPHNKLGYQNTRGDYGYLSRLTAEARREGRFPDLLDRRTIYRQLAAGTTARAALTDLADEFTVDRTDGQHYRIYLVIEKATLIDWLWTWFHGLGVPIVAIGGYASQTFEARVARECEEDRRTPVLIGATDLDSHGIAIWEDLVRRTSEVFAPENVHRVALWPAQIIPAWVNRGKTSEDDPHSKNINAEFVDRFGSYWEASGKTPPPGDRLDLPWQVELDAIAPADLRTAFQDAIDLYWDDDAHEDAVAREEAICDRLRTVAEEFEDEDDEDEEDDDEDDD